LSAYPYGQVAAAGISNQAYILSFAEEEVLEEHQLGIAGQFETIAWKPDRGWRLANMDLGLPGHGGFGWRADIKRLANRLARALKDTSETKLSLAEILACEPKVRFLSPAGIEALKLALEKRTPPIVLTRTEHGLIDYISATLPVPVDDNEG